MWDRHARWWQQNFTGGADPEYEEQILPMASYWLDGFARVLEVGAGEGQVARRAAAGSAGLVLGLEPSSVQIAEARARGGGPMYVRATAAEIPATSSSFDAAIVCLVLEHVDELEPAVGELARVVAPGGRLVLMLNHPLLQTPDSGWVDDHMIDPPEQYWRIGAYLREAVTLEKVAKGVRIRFVHRPLHRYINSFLAAGFDLEHLEEPAPPAGFVAAAPEYEEAANVPRLMVLVWRRR